MATTLRARLLQSLESALSSRAGDESEVEIRAGRMRAGAFVSGVTKDEFDAIVLHVGDVRHGWEVHQRWNMTFDYVSRLPPGVVQPFTLRVSTETIDPSTCDHRVKSAFPTTRYERTVARAVRKERLSTDTIAASDGHMCARVSHALERVTKPYQLFVDTTCVRAKVRLSVTQRYWRLDLTRVWQATGRTEIDRALRTRAPPTAFEVELEALSSDANARDAVALWFSFPPMRACASSACVVDEQPAPDNDAEQIAVDDNASDSDASDDL